MKTCILIGDSIRHGYEQTVIAAFDGDLDIWTPNENGGTSSNVLAHLDEWVVARTPDVIHLNCGLHDIARQEDDPTRSRITLDQYAQNIRTLFGRIRDETDALLLWARSTPIIEQRHNTTKGFGRYNTDIDRYNAAVDAIADEMNVPVNDLNKVATDAGLERILTPDGVHYTIEGYAILGKAVAAFIRKQVKGNIAP